MNDVNLAVTVLDKFAGLDIQGNGRPDAERLGKVAAPPNKESTSEYFYFWAERGKLCERTQIVTTTSQIGGRAVGLATSLGFAVASSLSFLA